MSLERGSMWAVVIFLSVATSLWAVIHAYIARRLLGVRSEDTKAYRRGRIALWVLFPLAPATMILSRVSGGELPMWFVWPAYIHMGVVFMGFCFVVFRDVGLLALRGGARMAKRPLSKERRVFLTRSTNAGVIGLTGAFSAFGVYEALREPELVEVDIPIDGLPPELDGYTIAQVSDIHVGPTIKGEFVDHIVQRVNALDADMVAVTGDLVDGSVEELRQYTNGFANLRGRDGVFFCTGNHEYYSGALEWVEEVRRLGWEPLINEHRMIEREGKKLLVAGCTDFGAARHLEEHTSDPAGAIDGAEEHDVSVLLAHQPKSIHAAAAAGYDVQLSGHTHGGQFFPPSLFVGFAHPFHEGLGKEDNTWIYVNRGTGYWGPPLRAGVPSEITLVRLVRA